ncbi:aldehyde dehydrogenase family protein [Agrobacterium tumefaciens]|uniref:aldehyde dehydrogenase family protein n=1 Tax=Agrobacterium tumefaciens TaxID=358 RepID=UPI001571D723|nr:aldehyde dehydrogenase family protein [Agrobacterium tumefaciens]NTB96042.1 aldehyde dehydrogenase family protein [Agrobacterium tumefaciens]NTC42973.1 aldehyde dehydrogenase family protein [Agrobacterium tumefaciens]
MQSRDRAIFPSATHWLEERPVYGHLIGNKWVEGTVPPISVIEPATGRPLAWLARGTEEDVNMAVAAARSALNGEWGTLTASERGRLMQKFADLVLQNVERLAWIEAFDTGKPISTARTDLRAVARYFQFYGEAADKVHGEVIPYLNNYNVTVVREPLGVTAHITPWNYPAQMFGRSLAPAIAMGNAVVMKPAAEACLVCLELGQLAIDAGFPSGALNIVTGKGTEAGAALTRHPDINFISFTGSPEVGKLVQEAAAVHHIKVVLELGGKSPQVVFADADLDLAAAAVCKAIIQNTGQTCSAGSRVLIERSIYDVFTRKLAERFAAVRVGLPEDDADLGPVINDIQQSRVLDFINNADLDGLALVAQTPVPKHLNAGFFVPPSVFGPVPADNRLVCQEVFGPVLATQVFDTEDEAVELANGTEFGLVAGVWTRDGSRQQRLARRIVSGQVFVNCYGAGGGVELPFGGTKRSGHGREKGLMALDEVSTTKTIVNYYG